MPGLTGLRSTGIEEAGLLCALSPRHYKGTTSSFQARFCGKVRVREVESIIKRIEHHIRSEEPSIARIFIETERILPDSP